MDSSEDHRWAYPVGQCRFSSTILITQIASFNETAIKEALETAKDVEVDKVVHVGEGQVLIDYRAYRGNA